MIAFLSNTSWQFAITSGLGIIAILIAIWSVLRRPIQLPITYEALAWEKVDASNDDVKDILSRPLAAGIGTKPLTFVTFSIQNSGHESIALPNRMEPLTIAFKEGAKIVDCTKIATIPEKIKFATRLDTEKVLLTFPLLDPKETIILRILITGHVDYAPAIYARIPGKKRIQRVNNRRFSKEVRIGSILALLSFILELYTDHGISPNWQLRFFDFFWLFMGIWLFLISFLSKKVPPHSHLIPLPSTILAFYKHAFIHALPFLIVLGIVGTIMYLYLGLKGIALLYLILIFGLFPLFFWYELYLGVKKFLQRRKKAYNIATLILLTGIPSFILWACGILLIFVPK